MAFALLLALLDQASLAYQNVPFWVLVTAHSLTVVHAYRGATPYWLVSWFLGFLGAFGGGMSSALLLQNPSVAALGLFARNEVGLCYTLTWWAVNYTPVAWLAALPPVQSPAKVLRAVLRANTVVQRVDAAVRLHPGVAAAPILLGTLSACGGTLLVDAFRHCAGYKQGPNELSHPGYALRSAALGALCQYLLVHVAGLLTSQQGLGLVVSLYVLQSLASDLTGQPCDFTAPLGRLFHAVTCIPSPEAAEQAAAAAKAAKAADGKSPRPARRRGASPTSSGGELSADERTPGSIFVRRSARQRDLAAAAAALH